MRVQNIESAAHAWMEVAVTTDEQTVRKTTTHDFLLIVRAAQIVVRNRPRQRAAARLALALRITAAHAIATCQQAGQAGRCRGQHERMRAKISSRRT